MASRKGTLLEKNVEQLLRLSGFNPQLNKIRNGYEIDIFLRYKNIKIAFECKQYERSTLAIRNLIHQWDSKNKELNFDKIVLILIGCDISSKNYQLAKKYGIIIWDEQKLTNLLDKSIEKKIDNRYTILKELGIKADEIKGEEKEKIKIEKTKQQIIIKKALDKMLKKGILKHPIIGDTYSHVTFEKEGTFFITISFYEKGFMLFFPESTVFTDKHIEDVRELLESLQFEDCVRKNIMRLEEKEFVFEKSVTYTMGGIYAQCGKDTDFISFLIDRIYRDVLQSDNNYIIKTQFEDDEDDE